MTNLNFTKIVIGTGGDSKTLSVEDFSELSYYRRMDVVLDDSVEFFNAEGLVPLAEALEAIKDAKLYEKQV